MAVDPVLSLLEELVTIGAPTFHEKRRSDFMFAWLKRELPMGEVGQDEAGNIWVDLSGGEGKVLLLDAHIDTVFPHETVTLRKEADRWHAPGVFDNTVSCAQLMIWLKRAAEAGKRIPVMGVFTVGEEGEGNLAGVRAIAKRFKERALGVLVLDLGMQWGAREVIGSVRYELTFSTKGGHSWNHFGTPNAIHEAARWIGKLEKAFPWKHGKRSFNVGTIEGGTGINVIASTVRFKLDVRSLDPDFLEDFRRWLNGELAAYPEGSEVAMLSREIGYREAGSLPEDHPLVKLMEETHQALDLPLEWELLSTNSNGYLGAGIPAVVTGVADGEGVHTEEEFLYLDSVAKGEKKLAVMMERWLSRYAGREG